MEGSNHQVSENTSYVCNYITIEYSDELAALMQFSFYITVEYKVSKMSYITAEYNDARFRVTSYQSTIHYIHRPYLPVKSRYMIILNSHALQNKLTGLLTSMYYISISSALDCKPTKMYSIIITGLQKRFRPLLRADLQIVTYLWFQGLNVYFKSMYHRLSIETRGSPSCDLILNVQLVFTMKTNKSQDSCEVGYLKVSS